MPINAQNATAQAAPTQDRIFREVPAGEYSAYLNRINMRDTKDGIPRVSMGYKVAAGDMKGEWVWDSCTLGNNKGWEVLAKKFAALCPEWAQPDDWAVSPEVAEREGKLIGEHLESTKACLKNIRVVVNERGFTNVYVR